MNSLGGLSVLHLSHEGDGCFVRNVVSTFAWTDRQQMLGASRTITIPGSIVLRSISQKSDPVSHDLIFMSVESSALSTCRIMHSTIRIANVRSSFPLPVSFLPFQITTLLSFRLSVWLHERVDPPNQLFVLYLLIWGVGVGIRKKSRQFSLKQG